MKEQLESIRQQALAALEDAATPAALESCWARRASSPPSGNRWASSPLRSGP